MARGVLLLCAAFAVFVLPFLSPDPPAILAETGAQEVGDPATLGLLSESERLLMESLERLQRGDLDGAVDELAGLIRRKPDFRLAQLIYGDLLMAQAGALQGFASPFGSGRQEIADLLDEARLRVRNLEQHPHEGMVPEPLLYLSEGQSYAIVVDLSAARLYLFRRNGGGGRPQLIANYYVSSGKNGPGKVREGDKRTPVGLYFITDYLSGQRLPDLYGSGALPINYPNEWDRLLRKTGYGIWLHGTPTDTYSRPPRSSDGCVALTNIDFESLGELVGIGTPVVISRAVTWLEPDEWKGRQDWFFARINEWYRDWNSQDPDQVLRHYSQEFHNQNQDFSGWSRQLRSLFQSEAGARMQFSDVSVLGYPAERPMVVVTYERQEPGQDLRGPLLRRQYWRLEEEEWKIVYEDTG